MDNTQQPCSHHVAATPQAQPLHTAACSRVSSHGSAVTGQQSLVSVHHHPVWDGDWRPHESGEYGVRDQVTRDRAPDSRAGFQLHDVRVLPASREQALASRRLVFTDAREKESTPHGGAPSKLCAQQRKRAEHTDAPWPNPRCSGRAKSAVGGCLAIALCNTLDLVLLLDGIAVGRTLRRVHDFVG